MSDYTRRDAVKMFGATAGTAGLTGCMGGNSEEPEQDESESNGEEDSEPENQNSEPSNQEGYQEVVERNDLSPPGEEMIEIYCTEMDSDTRDSVVTWMESSRENREIESIDFRKEGEKYLRITSSDDPYTGDKEEEVTVLNADSSGGGKLPWPDRFAANYMELFEEHRDNFRTVQEVLGNNPEC